MSFCARVVKLMAGSAIQAAVMIGFAGQAAQAGPCTADIDRFQAQLDTTIDTIAGRVKAGRESIDALLHHEPTPATIAAAEEQLGGGKETVQAVIAVRRARLADAAGDATGCQQALGDARRLIGL